jgi:serine/threonine protein kinase
VTREFDAKIADFGLAKLSTRRDDAGAGVELSQMRGTMGYVTPRVTENLT